MYGYPCRNEIDFKNGKCLDCNGSCITMGYDAFATSRNGTLRNNFYLVTGEKAPYCGKLIITFSIEVFQSRDICGQTEAEESEKSRKIIRNEFDYI